MDSWGGELFGELKTKDGEKGKQTKKNRNVTAYFAFSEFEASLGHVEILSVKYNGVLITSIGQFPGEPDYFTIGSTYLGCAGITTELFIRKVSMFPYSL